MRVLKALELIHVLIGAGGRIHGGYLAYMHRPLGLYNNNTPLMFLNLFRFRVYFIFFFLEINFFFFVF